MAASLRFFLFAFLLFLSLFQSAAAGGLSRDDLKDVKAIAIDKNIAMPEAMSYLGPNQGIGLLFGVAGAAVEHAAKQKRPEQVLVDYAAQNKISISDIVREETMEAVKKSGLVQLIDGEGKSANTLRIEIKQYGLFRPTLFTKKLVSILTVQYLLAGGKGETIWEDSYRVTPLSSPVEPTSLEDIKGDPKVLENLYRKAAQSIAQRAFPVQEKSP